MPPLPLNDLRALRQQERVILQRLAQIAPERIQRPETIDPRVVNTYIGIAGIPDGPPGYLRYYPQDFIVEEVTSDGTIATIEPEPVPDTLRPEDKTVYVDVVKIGMGTLEAVNQLANMLHITPAQIGYAGIKDTRALTSQRISIRKADWQPLLAASPSQLAVKIRSTGKGVLTIGQLQGNRFTITVRTPEPIDAAWFESAVSQLAENGFANFFGPQRFGNRQLNPRLGRLLCQGQPHEAIKLFLTETGPYDLPIYGDIRRLATQWYGDWVALEKIFKALPYTFHSEIAVVTSLQRDPTDWHAAVMSIADQARFWVYGYTAYLVNQLLSTAFTHEAAIPDPLPVPLDGPGNDAVYRELLEADGTADCYPQLKRYSFLQQRSRTMPAWIMPQLHGTAIIPAGAIVSFTLPKGVYATTFLMFLFRLYEGSPVPVWVKPNEVDAKEILGTGSVTQAISALEVPEDVLKPR